MKTFIFSPHSYKYKNMLYEKSRVEAEKDRIAADKRMKKIEETMDSWSNSHGSFAEEYFFNAFENEKKDFFGEKFNDIEKNLVHYWKILCYFAAKMSAMRY